MARQTPTMAEAMQRAAVSVPDFAALVGISTTSAWALVWDNKVRTVWIGKRRVVPVSEIERLLAPTQESA